MDTSRLVPQAIQRFLASVPEFPRDEQPKVHPIRYGFDTGVAFIFRRGLENTCLVTMVTVRDDYPETLRFSSWLCKEDLLTRLPFCTLHMPSRLTVLTTGPDTTFDVFYPLVEAYMNGEEVVGMTGSGIDYVGSYRMVPRARDTYLLTRNWPTRGSANMVIAVAETEKQARELAAEVDPKGNGVWEGEKGSVVTIMSESNPTALVIT